MGVPTTQGAAARHRASFAAFEASLPADEDWYALQAFLVVDGGVICTPFDTVAHAAAHAEQLVRRHVMAADAYSIFVALPSTLVIKQALHGMCTDLAAAVEECGGAHAPHCRQRHYATVAVAADAMRRTAGDVDALTGEERGALRAALCYWVKADAVLPLCMAIVFALHTLDDDDATAADIYAELARTYAACR